jgi:AAA family ATP:ADP antiporter
MWRPSLVVRPAERRDASAAFLTLFGFVASHAMLETARDAVFLAKVPSTHLPWVFIAIAVLSLAAADLQHRSARLGGRLGLSAWTAVAGVITIAFWALLPAVGAGGVYALYVWSGVLTTLVLVHFWTLLGTIFSITQAKRVYGLVGAGSVVGAVAGSGAATAIARMTSAHHLVLIAGVGFLVTSLVPLRFTRHAAPPAATAGGLTRGLVDDARLIARQPYPRKVAVLLIAATVCVTIADYLFKTTVAAHVPPAELGMYLGAVAFALNVVSFVVQIALVGFVVRRLGVSAALAVLPLLLVATGIGMIATGGLVAALAIKGADGALRYSLHRTASELAFLPLGDDARRRTKSFTDVVGQRGGQAVASLAILGLTAAAAPRWVLAVVLVGLAAIWLWTAIALRAPYLDLFRSRLRDRRAHRDDLGLDVASLETLVRALDSENDQEVLAALEVLEREGKPRLIPVLILYHPSDAVVERALEIFTRARRDNVVPIIDRLADHPSPRVRAATLAARSVLDPNARPLLMRLSFEESPEVRATIVVNLIASGELVGGEAAERLAALMRHGSVATKIALADAIGRRQAGGFDAELLALLDGGDTRDPRLRLAALRAIGRVRPAAALPRVIALLGEEATRPDAQQVLVDYGLPGFTALVAAIDDAALGSTCRARIPATIARFDPDVAAVVLLEWLTREKDGAVRYHILRALERITRRVPSLVLDRALLERTIDATVSRAYRYLDRRIILTRGAEAVPARATPGHAVLVSLLRDKEQNAIARLFGMIGLINRTDDYTDIYRGLSAPGRDARATSVELIEATLREPLRSAVLGLVDDLPDADRLAASGRYHTPLALDYVALLGRMLGSTSESVRDLTVFHIGELRLRELESAVAALRATDSAEIPRTLELLAEGR